MPRYIIETNRYINNDRLMISVLRDRLPFATLSENVPDLHLEEGEFVLNHDFSRERNKEFLQELLDSGMFEDTGCTCTYGYVIEQPIWKYKGPTKSGWKLSLLLQAQ